MCDPWPHRWKIERAAALLAGGLASLWLAACATTGRTSAAAVRPSRGSAATASSLSPDLRQLAAAEQALEKTLAVLQQAPAGRSNEVALDPADRGRALAAARETLTEVAAAVAYVQAHPAAPGPRPGPEPLVPTGIRPAAVPAFIDRNPLGRFTNPGLVESLDALNAALGGLTDGHPEAVPGSLLGGMDGNREKIIYGLALTGSEINAGLNATYDRWVAHEQQSTGIAVPD